MFQRVGKCFRKHLCCRGYETLSRFRYRNTFLSPSGCISIDLKTGKKTSGIDLSKLISGKHFSNDLTFDKAGNAYVSDSFANAIYKVTPNRQASVFAKHDLFKSEGVSLNGIVAHSAGFLANGAFYAFERISVNKTRACWTNQSRIQNESV